MDKEQQRRSDLLLDLDPFEEMERGNPNLREIVEDRKVEEIAHGVVRTTSRFVYTFEDGEQVELNCYRDKGGQDGGYNDREAHQA